MNNPMARGKTTTIENQGNVSNLIRAILSTEAKFVIAIVGFVMGVVAPYYQMKQDVALIQQNIATINSNHMQHTEDLAQQVKDTISQVKNNQDAIQQLQLQQAVILEKLTR